MMIISVNFLIMPLNAKYQTVAMGVLMLMNILVVTRSMNAVEVIRKGSSSRHKVELDHVVVMSHTVQTSMIVVMDLSRILELVQQLLSAQMKKDLDQLGAK